MIRDADAGDSTAIAHIYNHYVRTTWITFEEEPVVPAEMARRIEDVRRDFPWLVYERDAVIEGFAFANKWKPRAAYRHSAETSIYLSKDRVGAGLGHQLYEELLRRLRAMNVHAVIGGIAQPNPSSVALHERLGFTKVAHFREVGFKFDRWVDVAYWQLTL